ncbi:MAG: hypothetical protein KAI79_12990 [Bacteroidales bacterium]|nr:hypothetical protein [Bacteroidales bacterium]
MNNRNLASGIKIEWIDNLSINQAIAKGHQTPFYHKGETNFYRTNVADDP